MNKLHTHLRLLVGMICLFAFTQLTAQSATIGDYVWNDSNSNGIQDAGESGMAGVFVILENSGGVAVDFVTTDGNGNYSFSAAAGTYRVKFANPGGVFPSPQGQQSTQDLLGYTDYFTVGAGDVNNSIDAGFGPPAPQCSLTVTLLDVMCDQMDTSNPNDDQFSFTLTIIGGGPWGWSGGGLSGTYGVPTVFGPYDVSNGEVCIEFHDMDNPTCIGNICVDAPPPCSVPGPCQVTDAGEIGGDESNCGPYNPSVITSEEAPTVDGDGEIEYLWLSSKNGCPTSFHQRIFGATEATYDPPMIFQTMYYVRWARTVGCNNWQNGKSNCVVKEVVVEGEDCNSNVCESRMAMNSSVCGTDTDFAMYAPTLTLSNNSIGDYWHIEEAQFIEFENGTAKILGRIQNNNELNAYWNLDLNLSGRTFFPQGDSPVESDCYEVNTSDWYYYTNVSGTATGEVTLEGAVLNLSLAGNALQVGTGANLHNLTQFGLYGDFNYVVASSANDPIGIYSESFIELNFTVTGGVTNCVPDGTGCANDNILFIVDNIDLNESDEAVATHLEATGYTVTTQDDMFLDPWDAMGFGLVVISSTVNSEWVNGVFANVDVPVLSNEAYIFDNLGMTGGDNNSCFGTSVGTHLDVVAPSHPTSAGREGVVKVYTFPRNLSWGVATGDGVNVAALNDQPNKYGVFAYDQGDLMFEGQIAPARRVGFFIGEQAGAYMAEEGWNLFDASVAWAIDCGLTTQMFSYTNPDENGVDAIAPATTLDGEIDIVAYPNPARQEVNLDLGAYADMEAYITIYDNTFRPVKTMYLPEGWGQAVYVDLAGLSSGLHFVQVSGLQTGASGTAKLMIAR